MFVLREKYIYPFIYTSIVIGTLRSRYRYKYRYRDPHFMIHLAYMQLAIRTFDPSGLGIRTCN